MLRIANVFSHVCFRLFFHAFAGCAEKFAFSLLKLFGFLLRQPFVCTHAERKSRAMQNFVREPARLLTRFLYQVEKCKR